MTKHQPATPLSTRRFDPFFPARELRNGMSCVVVAAGEWEHAVSDRSQLIEALRKMTASAEAVHSFGLKDDVPPLTAVCFSDAQYEARVLLRSIGEDA